MNRSQFRKFNCYSRFIPAKLRWPMAWKLALAIHVASVTMVATTVPLPAQVDPVRFKMHFPTMPSQATSGQVREIEFLGGSTPGMLAVGYFNRTDRAFSALVYDSSALIDPASTYLGTTPPSGNLWDGYDLLGPPSQWDQNWDDDTIHETYDQLIFNNISAGGLAAGILYGANAVPSQLPVYLDLLPDSGSLELKRIPLPAVAAGGRAMYVNQAGEILVRLWDANNVDLGPYVFQPARNGSSEVRTVIPFLAGFELLRGFNALGQIMTEDNDVVARHTLGAGTTQQFPNYLLRTISTGFTETFPELIKLPDNTYNGAINEFGQFIGTFYVSRGPGRGRWAARYGGLPLAIKEREWQPPIAGSDRVDSINDSGDAIDNLPQGNQEVGYDAYYYHEGLPSEGDETFISSVKSLILPESDPGNIFLDTGRISNVLISNRNASGFGWLYGTYPTGVDRTGIAFLEPIIPGQTPGISVSPVTGLVTSESGDSDSFDVVLDSEPTASVAIGINSSNTVEGTVDQSSLTFTTGNWNTPQTVTVTGVDDALDDGNIDYTIFTAAAISTDSNYDGLNADDVFVTNLDDEMPTGGPTTYVSDDTPTAIPDNSPLGAMSVITDVGDFVPVSLIVSLDISHPRPSDLEAWVTGPDGTQRELLNVPGDNDLTDLITDTDGDWMLEVIDTKKRKEGTLNSWKITIDE